MNKTYNYAVINREHRFVELSDDRSALRFMPLLEQLVERAEVVNNGMLYVLIGNLRKFDFLMHRDYKVERYVEDEIQYTRLLKRPYVGTGWVEMKDTEKIEMVLPEVRSITTLGKVTRIEY